MKKRGDDIIKNDKEELKLVKKLKNRNKSIVDWMMGEEEKLKCDENREEDIKRIEKDIKELRKVLERIKLVGKKM